MEMIDIWDLKPVATLTDDIVLLQKPGSNLVAQCNFVSRRFDTVQLASIYTKFNPYNPIMENGDRFLYRIQKDISDEETLRMLVEFTEKLNIEENNKKSNDGE